MLHWNAHPQQTSSPRCSTRPGPPLFFCGLAPALSSSDSQISFPGSHPCSPCGALVWLFASFRFSSLETNSCVSSQTLCKKLTRTQDVQTHCRYPFLSAILARDDEGVATRGTQEITSFLLGLTGTPVVPLSSAGRAGISLKHGLGSTNFQ